MRGCGRLEGTRIGRVGLSCSGTRRGRAADQAGWPGPASPQHRDKTRLRAEIVVTMRLHFGAGGNRLGLMRCSRGVARHRCAGPRQMHGRRSGGSISCCVVSYHAAAGMNKQRGGAWGLGGGAGWAERNGAAAGCSPRHADRPALARRAPAIGQARWGCGGRRCCKLLQALHHGWVLAATAWRAPDTARPSGSDHVQAVGAGVAVGAFV